MLLCPSLPVPASGSTPQRASAPRPSGVSAQSLHSQPAFRASAALCAAARGLTNSRCGLRPPQTRRGKATVNNTGILLPIAPAQGGAQQTQEHPHAATQQRPPQEQQGRANTHSPGTAARFPTRPVWPKPAGYTPLPPSPRALTPPLQVCVLASPGARPRVPSAPGACSRRGRRPHSW